MIVRCTATFLRSYDALPDVTKQAVRAALQGFAETPLIPSQHARRINAAPGVWAVPYFLDSAQRAEAKNTPTSPRWITSTAGLHIKSMPSRILMPCCAYCGM